MIVAVGGWRGYGATTVACALASTWASSESEAWLIEADPAGGVLSGRVDMNPRCVGGLERVAFPVDRCPAVERFREVAHRSGGLCMVSAPVDPFRAHSCHHPRTPWVPSLAELGEFVVVDVGRIRAATAAWDVLAIADVVVVVSSPEVASVVSSAEWIYAVGRVSPRDPGIDEGIARLCVVESPGGLFFNRASLTADLGGVCAGWIPWDPAAVDLLYRGASVDNRGYRRGGFMPAIDRLGAALRSGVRPSSEVIS
jgi:hypothetical protein